jgi:uncharacterized membrane protein
MAVVEKLDMGSERLESFSDCVLSIIITIMVLEFKVPHDASPWALLQIWPVFVSYGLSFLMIAVYWVNHHHLFHLTKRVNSLVLWANTLLLFCLSLVPFFTAYMNEHERNSFSTAMYSGILLLCALAFTVLRRSINGHFKKDSEVRLNEIAASHKNWLAISIYSSAIIMAYFYPLASLVLDFSVAALYFIPGFYLEKQI